MPVEAKPLFRPDVVRNHVAGFKLPALVEQFQPTLEKWQNLIAALTRQLADAEAEINDRVYKLFHLTPDEIKLLQREVEH